MAPSRRLPFVRSLGSWLNQRHFSLTHAHVFPLYLCPPTSTRYSIFVTSPPSFPLTLSQPQFSSHLHRLSDYRRLSVGRDFDVGHRELKRLSPSIAAGQSRHSRSLDETLIETPFSNSRQIHWRESLSLLLRHPSLSLKRSITSRYVVLYIHVLSVPSSSPDMRLRAALLVPHIPSVGIAGSRIIWFVCPLTP